MFLLGRDHIIFVLLQLWELSNAQHHCIIGIDLWSFIEMTKRALCGIVVQQHEHPLHGAKSNRCSTPTLFLLNAALIDFPSTPCPNLLL